MLRKGAKLGCYEGTKIDTIFFCYVSVPYQLCILHNLADVIMEASSKNDAENKIKNVTKSEFPDYFYGSCILSNHRRCLHPASFSVSHRRLCTNDLY